MLILFILLKQLPYFYQMIRVVILGSGNVAKHLYAGFLHQKSITVIQCYNRKGNVIGPDQNKKTVVKYLDELVEADIYIIAISDDAIKDITAQLPFDNRLVVHTSGSVPMQAIHERNRQGVFYPLQTFSTDKPVDFGSIPFCLESNEEKDMKLLQKLASALSEKMYTITSEQRNALHVAAVLVNNFTNYLYTTGNEICEEHNIPFEILHPLIQETAQKITSMSPKDAQTGPAIRNDNKTIARHLKILSNQTQKEIYQYLTKAIQSKYGKKL